MQSYHSGMISGTVVRVEDKSHSFPAAIVTVAGETYRDGKALTFYEQVRLRDNAGSAALSLRVGEPVLFDSASVEQLIWTDLETKDPRSQVVIRAKGFARLGNVQTKTVNDQAVLLGAINHFALRGRPVRDAVVKETKSGTVAEVSLALSLGEGDRSRPHYFPLEAWHGLSSQLAPIRKGDLVICEVMVKTDTAMIGGERRYFTKLEARSVACLSGVQR